MFQGQNASCRRFAYTIVEQAKTGMSDARWRKEYEIDYGALSGQRVFPEY